jgi:Cys-rich protein (TIGR01571 family)
MTPLERSRFASEAANNDEVALPLGPLGTAREFLNSTRRNIRDHHGWTSGIGDCMSDWKSCCAVLLCEATVMGQLTERVWNRKYTCIIVATLLWAGAIGNLVATWYTPPCSVSVDENGDGYVSQEEMAALDPNQDGFITTGELAERTDTYYDCEEAYYLSWRYGLASTLAVLFLAGMFTLTMLVRRHIRKRDSIPVTVCSGFDDCICAVVCLPCAQCQIMRHEGLVGDKYRLVSPNGTTNFDGTAPMV